MPTILDLYTASTTAGTTLAASNAAVVAAQKALAADQTTAATDATAKAAADATLLTALAVTGPVLANGSTLLENAGGSLRVLSLPDASTVTVPTSALAPTPAAS